MTGQVKCLPAFPLSEPRQLEDYSYKILLNSPLGIQLKPKQRTVESGKTYVIICTYAPVFFLHHCCQMKGRKIVLQTEGAPLSARSVSTSLDGNGYFCFRVAPGVHHIQVCSLHVYTVCNRQ